MSQLPFQMGTTLPEDNSDGSTEIMSSASTAESETHSTLLCESSSREVFMMPAPRPLVAPIPPDVQSGDELSDEMTDDEAAPANESDADRQIRERRNKIQQSRKNRARQRRTAQQNYERDLQAYNTELQGRRLAEEAAAQQAKQPERQKKTSAHVASEPNLSLEIFTLTVKLLAQKYTKHLMRTSSRLPKIFGRNLTSLWRNKRYASCLRRLLFSFKGAMHHH